jgi:hypothetical protein
VKLKCNTRSKRLLSLLAFVCLGYAGVVLWRYATESELDRWLRYANSAVLKAGARRDVRGELVQAVRDRAQEWFIPLVELETRPLEGSWYHRFHFRTPPQLRTLLPKPGRLRGNYDRYSWLFGDLLSRQRNSAPFFAAMKHSSPRVRVATVSILSNSPDMATVLQSQIVDLLESYTDLQPQQTCARALMTIKNPTEATRNRLLGLAPSYPDVDLLLVEVLRKADVEGEYWPAKFVSIVERLRQEPLYLAGAARMMKDVKGKPGTVVEALQQLADSEHDYVRRPALEALEIP